MEELAYIKLTPNQIKKLLFEYFGIEEEKQN